MQLLLSIVTNTATILGSFGTLIALIVAIKSLKYTRTALTKQTEALDKQVEALDKQTEALEQQRAVDKNTMWVSTVQWALGVINDPDMDMFPEYRTFARNTLVAYIKDPPKPLENVSSNPEVQRFIRDADAYLSAYLIGLTDALNTDSSGTVGDKEECEGSEDNDNITDKKPQD